MQIGTVKIDGRLVLAPMAGVTDLAFRRICREHGAALTVTEMVSTKALCYQDKKTPRLLELAPDEHPAAAQIFGHDPETMAEGAKIALEKSGCDIIDHVKTQIPYAAICAGVSIVLYTVLGFVM